MANTTGKKWGGRQKGTPNKKTFDNIALAKEMDADPLEFMLRVMKGDWEWLGYDKKKDDYDHDHIKLDHRISCARDAAPYIHARLKTIEHKGDIGVGGLVGQVMSEILGEEEEEESDESED